MSKRNQKGKTNSEAILFSAVILAFSILSVGAFLIAKNHAETMLKTVPVSGTEAIGSEAAGAPDTTDREQSETSTSGNPDLTADTTDISEPQYGEEYSTSPLPQWSSQYAFCEKVIEIARNEPTEAEDASGVTKYGTHFENPTGEWCTEFAVWCILQAQTELSVEYTNVYYPYTSWAGGCVQWYKKKDLFFLRDKYVPRRGDMIFFDYNSDGTADHTGLVTGVEFDSTENKLYILTVEGNLPEDYPKGSIKERRLAADWATILGYGTFIYDSALNAR